NSNRTATLTNPSADHMESLTVETSIPTVSLPVPTVCFTDSQEPSNPSWVEAMQEELLKFKIQNVWSLVDCPKGDLEFPARVYKVKKVMYGLHQAPRAWQRGNFILVQVYVDDIIFGSSNSQLCRDFEALMHAKFQMSAMDVRSANTPMDKENPWGKDGTGKDVDLHHYRSMIGSFMYLTASRPDIMFAVCACARHQVTLKECHLHTVKRIFRYLKGHPKLGLWYPKESPFDLVTHSDTASCYGQVLWIQMQLLDYGDCFEKKLISVDHIHTDENVVDLLTKPFDAGRFQYLVGSIGMVEHAMRGSVLGNHIIYCLLQDLLECLTFESEHNVDFYPIVGFVEVSPLRYALTFKPTVYVSHIRQFWSTARIETTEEGTKILTTIDGILRSVTESSLRKNLKLKDEEGISSLPNAEVFENLTLMGYNISPNQKFTFQKGRFSHQWKYLIHTIMQCLSPKSTGFSEFSSNIATALVCLATNRVYNFSKMIFNGMVKNDNNKVSKFLMYPRVKAQAHQLSPIIHPPLRRARIAQSSALSSVENEPASPLRDISQCEACPTDSGFEADQDRANIAKTSTLPHESTLRVTFLAADEGSMQHKLDELTALCTSLQRQPSEMVSRFEAQELEINSLKARIKLLEDKDRGVAEHSGDDAPIKGRRLDVGEEAAKRVSNDTKEMATVLTSMDAATVLSSGVAEVPTGSGFIPTAGPPATEVPTGSDVVPTTGLIFATATVVTPYTRRKGKETMVESETLKKKKVQEQIDAQVTRELEEQMARKDQRMSEQIARDAEIARIHVEEKLQIMIDGLDRSNETGAKYLQEYHQFAIELPLERRIELISDLVRYQYNYAKAKDFKGMTLEEIKENFDSLWKQIHDFIPIGSKEEAERFKRKGIRYEQESVKKLKTSEEVKASEEVLEEKVKEMMQLVLIEEIIRLGGSSASYQFFVDLLKHLDREDLNQLWTLVKESLNIRPASSDKEMKLWVELKRLYEPDVEDQLWTHTQNMTHALVEWKMYDSCVVHHVTSKDNEIFMLIEKDYPLRKGPAIVMICYKLQVENYYQMGSDLILKIHKIENRLRQEDD
nr:hypothetical protein [Tanacetum cinerariifolium]